MSLPPPFLTPVPEQTALIAHQAFPQGNLYLQMRDVLGTIYEDDLFAAVYSGEGQPALHPWQLALVTVMQFAENLTDRQAADAVRARLDWKYALNLEVTDAGFHYSVLCEFRNRLLTGHLEHVLLDRLLMLCAERGWFQQHGRQRTDSTYVLGAVKSLNILELVGETVRHVLNVLATVVPEWLRTQVPTEWFERYGERIEDYRLPKEQTIRDALSVTYGKDGFLILAWVEQDETMAWLNDIPAVHTLRQVWTQQYRWHDGQVERLTPTEMIGSGKWIRSPYDPEVRFGKKRAFEWTGYKVHLTEACDETTPHLITQVHTAPAMEQDHHALTTIQADLAANNRLPGEHLVDAGYVSAKRIIHSRERHGIDLVGPVHSDPSWQARTPGALDVSQFTIDWQAEQVICPHDQHSASWFPSHDAKGESVVQILFAKQTCMPCPLRDRCTKARTTGRSLTIRFPQERHDELQAARQRQRTPEFRDTYRARCGIEGTFAQTTRLTGMRRARYVGTAKTHLQHVCTAAATNVLRVMRWLNDTPFAPTRVSRFAALAA